MQVPENVRSRGTARGAIPIASKAGLAVTALGVLADVVAHLDAGLVRADGAMTGPQLSAHLVTFLGMVLVLVGIVLDGVRATRRTHALATHGRGRHAVR